MLYFIGLTYADIQISTGLSVGSECYQPDLALSPEPDFSSHLIGRVQQHDLQILTGKTS